MATIKAYTDISQSKALSTILPLESADMRYDEHILYIDGTPKVGYKKGVTDGIPCWSFAALLDILPFHLIVNNQRYAFSMHKGLNKDGETYMFRYNVFNTDVCLYSTDYYNNPVDACVDMIEKLHELNLL